MGIKQNLVWRAEFKLDKPLQVFCAGDFQVLNQELQTVKWEEWIKKWNQQQTNVCQIYEISPHGYGGRTKVN